MSSILKPGVHGAGMLPIAAMGSIGQDAASGAWLTGGISASDVHAAYEAEGAASLAASYSNLNDPGTDDAGVGVAPTWDAVNGWKFNGVNQYLTTTFLPQNDQSQSVIVKYTTLTNNGCLTGCSSVVNTYFWIRPQLVGGQAYYGNGGTSIQAGGLAAATIAVAGNQGYLNGVAHGAAIGPYTNIPIRSMAIGARRTHTIDSFCAVYIQRWYGYTIALTGPQVAAIVVAM